jgi:hypothetical protein
MAKKGEFRAPSRGQRATAGRCPAMAIQLLVANYWSPASRRPPVAN